MKTKPTTVSAATANFQPVRLRKFLALAASILLTITSASAALRQYQAIWSGASFANSASAIGIITIDDALLLNPGENNDIFGALNSAIVSVTVTVSGASAGNGTFTTADFYEYVLSMTDELDLDMNWVGQPQPAAGDTWGNPDSAAHDFNLFNNGISLAPNAITLYVLEAAGGEQMLLTSFAPTEDDGELKVGQSVANIANAIVSTLYPPAVAPDGNWYLRAKVKGSITGSGISSTNDYCLLSWNGSIASGIVREGGSLEGNPLAAFGDPVFENNQLYFSGKLLVGGSITTANDDILARVDVSGANLIQLAREGNAATDVPGFTYSKFLWVHPIPGGLFFGAKLAGSPAKKTGVYFTDGVTIQLLAVTDGSVIIGGEAKTIKSITSPVASVPANSQTRVGNTNSVVLLVKTTDGVAALKQFTSSP